jgi:guanylate kinase
MGHIFILCGPPASGKTTLLNMISAKKLPLKQFQRITTRALRPEEGDKGNSSLEYEFLTRGEFAGRLARGNVANFIEWNKNLYATDIARLNAARDGKDDYVLHEDMPSAVHLKRTFGASVTIVLLFTEDRDDLLSIEFAGVAETNRASIAEWQRRLGLKYSDAAKLKGQAESESKRAAYIQEKMQRALPDLAFMAGRIKDGEDIRVIPNREGKQDHTFAEFKKIVREVNKKGVGGGKFAFVLMPFGDVRSDGDRETTPDFDKLYSFVIQPAIQSEGINCKRGDKISKSVHVFQDVTQHIQQAEVVIVDISGGNANVFLELGMCLSLNKKNIIIISRDKDDKVPFNALNLRRIKYDDNAEGWVKLGSEIKKHWKEMKNSGSTA